MFEAGVKEGRGSWGMGVQITRDRRVHVMAFMDRVACCILAFFGEYIGPPIEAFG